MRFTCLIINFLQVLTFQRGPVLERRKRGREMERGKRTWGRRAEGRMSARNTSSALPNTKTGLSRLSLSSYFIPFVTGTRTGLQRRLQWAHQSTPTDCGPTDTLEVGINFFVENVEKATAKWGNESSLFFLLLFFASFLLFRWCFSIFFFPLKAFTCRRRWGSGRHLVFVRCSFGEVSVLLSVFSFFLSFALSHSPLADSSDKLSSSSAHMALGENQCPYVSSAALHCTDEG